MFIAAVPLARLFLSADQANVATTAAGLLRIVSVIMPAFALVMILSGALRGAGDTRFILYVSTVLAVSMSAATWVGIEWLGFGLFGAWSIITVAIMSVGIVYTLRFIQGRWQDMRVIEAEYTLGDLPVPHVEVQPQPVEI